ncbi:fimbrial outer membrane usher protein [Escherichia coli]|uniref:Fimbrial outer membrane usher protein n=1 Tax=Escherichia coli TaxID=562 RepID=A0A377DAR0_ECOLX|nr:fimbrial outer membrane usher protein [Escherichia coli]
MEVIPSKGALVRAEFNAHVGIRGLFNVHYRNKPVPFGAMVSVPTEGTTQITGIVGDSGQVYLSGLPLQGIIIYSGEKELISNVGKLSITEKRTG